MRLVRVAVPVPALDALTYAIPDEFPEPLVGARVLVPLGKRVLTGCVVESEPRATGRGPRAAEEAPRAADVKPIIDILDDEPFLPADVVALTTWVAEYYACGLGEAIAASMPPRAWVESERYARITESGHGRLLTERGLRRQVLDRLVDDKPVRIDALA
jgi:primosomal protein N' (replication factor Y)